MKIIKWFIFVSLATCLFVDTSTGQSVIADRSILNSFLGVNRVDEGFESLNLGDGSGIRLSTPINSISADGYTNILVPGVTFNSSSGWIDWYGNNLGELTTRTIEGGQDIIVDFWEPTYAFGIDLKDSPLSRRALTVGVILYAADDSSIIYSNNSIPITDLLAGTFFGFQSSGGIGAVTFSSTSSIEPGYTPFLDNLSFFTTPIPEPATITFALLGLGAFTWRLRKK